MNTQIPEGQGKQSSPIEPAIQRSSARASEIDRHIGGRTRARRVMVGLSQQQMALLIGVTRQQLQKYERGHNCMSAGRLYHIANILSVPVSWFFEMMETQPRKASPPLGE